MRRVLAILLMLFVPLQFSWSAVQSFQGHVGGDVATLGFHSHDSGHTHHERGSPAPHDESLAGSDTSTDGGDGHPGGHYHPIFVSLVLDADLTLAEAPSGSPPVRPPATFSSRVPPLFDWPPSTRC